MRILCYLRGIWDYLRYGFWAPHFYEETSREPHQIVIATDRSFRVSDTLQHTPNEDVYTDATVVSFACKRCGKKDTGFIANAAEHPW